MRRFYLQTQDGFGSIYELNSTTDVKYTERGKATDFPVEAGGTSSDNYTETPTTISFSGTITSVGAGVSPEQFSEGIVRLKKTKQLLTVYSVAMLGGTANCLIETLEFTHTPKRGVSGSAISAKVDINFKQVRVANQARVVAIPKKSFEGLLSEKEKSSAGTKRVDGDKDDPNSSSSKVLALFKEYFSSNDDEVAQ